MTHSWKAFDKAKQIVEMLIESGVMDRNAQSKRNTIQGEIQIILEED